MDQSDKQTFLATFCYEKGSKKDGKYSQKQFQLRKKIGNCKGALPACNGPDICLKTTAIYKQYK